MAFGLDSMQRAICPPNKPGLCPEMLPVNGSILLQHLMNVSFSFLDEEVYFDEQGDPPGKYEILNFQRRRPINTDSSGQFTYEDLDGSFPPSRPADSVSAQDLLVADLANNNTSNMNEKRRLNPLYDSYSTLKVYRPQQQQQQQQPQPQQQTTSTPASGQSIKLPGIRVPAQAAPQAGARLSRGAMIRQQPLPHNQSFQRYV